MLEPHGYGGAGPQVQIAGWVLDAIRQQCDFTSLCDRIVTGSLHWYNVLLYGSVQVNCLMEC